MGTRLLLAAVSCAALTACGTTVPLTSQQQLAPGGVDAGLGAPGTSPSGGASAPGTTGVLGGGTSGGSPVLSGGGSSGSVSGTGAGGSTSGGSTSGGSTSGGTVAGYGQGITPTTVKIGYAYDPNADATNATIVQGVSAGSATQLNNAYAEKLNAMGGLGGKKIVLDAFAVNEQATDFNAELARACKHFTEDAKDFAVMTGGDAALAACLEKGGVMTVETNLTITSDADFAASPHYFEPATMAMGRRARNLPQALQDQGWFGTSAKVGVLTYDTAGYKSAVEKELLPRLKALGHPVDASNVAYVAYPAAYSEYSALASAVSSAVLRFRQNGVTHVVDLDAKGVATLFLMSNAESQQWHPEYAIDSAAGVQTLYEGGNIQADQAAHATGIGWLPGLDVPADKVPDNPVAKACLAYFASKGAAATDNNARTVQLAVCDTFEALKVALDGGARDRDAAARALEAYGDRFQAATALGTGFNARRHDGVSAFRYLKWDAACTCMAYVGGNRPAL